MNYEIKMVQPIIEGYEDCLFYGGTIAEIVIDKDKSLVMGVYGDVRATLYDENDNEIAFVKDKGNNGRFYDEMKSYVNQKNIHDLMDNWDANMPNTKKLQIVDNNWVEINGLYKGQFIEFYLLDNILDSIRVDDAIEEVKAGIDCWIEQLNEKIEED